MAQDGDTSGGVNSFRTGKAVQSTLYPSITVCDQISANT